MTKLIRDFDKLDKQAECEAKALSKLYELRPKKQGYHKRIAFGSGFWRVKE